MSQKPTYEELEQRIKELRKKAVERKKVEEALKKSEKRYRSLVDNIDFGVTMIDSDHNIVMTNVSQARMFKKPAHEFIGKKCFREYEKRENVCPHCPGVQAMSTGHTAHTETKGIRDDGSHFSVSINAFPILNEEGHPTGFIEIVEDITERKKAEEALRKSEERYRRIFENSVVGIFQSTSEGRYISVNHALAKMLGYSSPADLISSISDISEQYYVDPEDRHQYQQILQKDEIVENFEFRAKRKNGSQIWVSNSTRAYFDQYGKVVSYEGIVVDITERKRVEEALRNSERRLADIISFLPDATFAIDTEGKVIAWNRAIEDLTGVKAEDMIGKGDYEYAITFYKHRRPVLIDLVLNKDEDIAKTYEYVKKKGEILVSESKNPPFVPEPSLFWNSAQPLYNTSGEITGAIEVIRDITDRMLAEEALRESEEKYRNILENINDGYFEVDIAGNFTFFNDSMCRILGYPEDELMGMNNRKYMDEEVAKKVYKDFNKVYRTGKSTKAIDWKLIRKDGSECFLETVISLIKDSNDQPIGFRGIARDITDRKKLEEQLRQSHKMESIGTLAGGIAHDFNNILGIILGNTELAMDDVPEWNPAKFNLKEIQTASLRAKNVVRQLLSFARKTSLEKKPTNVVPIIKESLKLLRSSIPKSIEFRQNIAKDVGTILADSTQINQVLINLCTNAYHAMPDGGILEVSLKNVEINEKISTAYPEEPGHYINLTVSDTGHGISKETIYRIFDPYFTTKEIGRGTGLGLAVVHGIIKEYDGIITVESELGKGTTFSIFFPVIEKEAIIVTKIDEELPSGSESIFFIDDEDSLVKLGCQRLERLGYKVQGTTNPIEALDRFRSKPDQYDLIITDMTMPQMTGDKLVKEILNIRPDIPIILCTGFSEKIDEKKAKAIGATDYIEKPIDKQDFAFKVRKVLDGKQK